MSHSHNQTTKGENHEDSTAVRSKELPNDGSISIAP